jgi:radical SAM protein with 4Fe4S-binding SPASM domain
MDANNTDLCYSMIAGNKDLINLLSKFTLRRSANAIGVLAGYWLSKLAGKPIVFGFPVSLSIEPTTSCNLRCPECPSGLRSFTRETGMLEEKLFKKVIDEVHDRIYYLLFYFQGEPFLNPGFLEMVRYSASKKIYTATSTNGHFLDDETARETVESGLDRLIISIDGTTQETYEKYRIGGRLDKVIEGAQNIIAWKKKLKSSTPQVVFQFLVVKPNQHQIADAKKLAKQTGVDRIVFKTAQIYDYKNGSNLIPTITEYSRYRIKKDNTYEIKNELLNHCWRLWHSAVITWDGQLLPCCFDKDANYKMGNLRKEDFKPVWKGNDYMNFRKSVLSGRKEIDICTNCTEGTKVFN